VSDLFNKELSIKIPNPLTKKKIKNSDEKELAEPEKKHRMIGKVEIETVSLTIPKRSLQDVTQDYTHFYTEFVEEEDHYIVQLYFKRKK
jgi:hypothetical protein